MPVVFELRRKYAEDGLTSQLIKDFQSEVMEFYKVKGRHSQPWRQQRSYGYDPYLIVVSEIMLQQTQVSRVMQKFSSFIEKFPDFETVAKASEKELLLEWQGLGYNRRALNLQKLSQIILKDFDGLVPEDPKILRTLPGLGPATASSIAAFAFNKPVVFIETNIRRVFIHYFFSDDLVVSDKELLPLIEASLLRENPREWYWGLMDLGTALKKSVKNPNQRSRHYVKQKKFAGSDRELRGKILRELLSEKTSDEKILAKKFGERTDRVEKILYEMVSEGFFVRDESGSYRIKDIGDEK